MMINAPVSLARSQPSVTMGVGNDTAVVWNENGATTLATLTANVRSAGPLTYASTGLSSLPTVAWTNRGIAIADVFELAGSGYDLQLLSVEIDGGVLSPRTTISTNPAGTILPRLSTSGDEVLLTSVRVAGTSFGALTVMPLINGTPGPATTFANVGSFGRPSAVKSNGSWFFAASDEQGGTRGLRLGRFEPDAGLAIDLGQLPGSPPAHYPWPTVLAPTSLAVTSSGELWLATTSGSTVFERDVVVGRVQPTSPTLFATDGGARILLTSPAQTSARLAIGSSALLAVWAEQVAPESARVFSRLHDRRLTSVAPRVAISAAQPFTHDVRGIDAVATSSGFAVAWLAGTNKETVHLLQLDTEGRVTGADTPVFDSLYSVPSAPSLISVAGQPWAFFGVASPSAGLWLSRGELDGGWTPPTQVISTNPFDSVATASNGSTVFVAWSWGGGVWGSRVQFDGGTTNDHLQGPLFQNIASSVAVASDGTDYLVAWADQLTAGPRLLGVFISGATGRPTGASLTLLSPAEAPPLSWGRAAPTPHLTFAASNYQLVFDAVLDGGGGLMSRPIARDGTVGPLRIDANLPQHQFDGRVSSDGRGRTVLSWTESTSEPTTLVAGTIALILSAGETCLSAAECASGRCSAGRCCEVDGGCGSPDAGTGDAGIDAGSVDAGLADAGSLDSGVADAGLVVDAGSLDGGSGDAGLTGDAGSSTDAGSEDGGGDAGRAPSIDVDAGQAGARQFAVGCVTTGFDVSWCAALALLIARRRTTKRCGSRRSPSLASVFRR